MANSATPEAACSKKSHRERRSISSRTSSPLRKLLSLSLEKATLLSLRSTSVRYRTLPRGQRESTSAKNEGESVATKTLAFGCRAR